MYVCVPGICISFEPTNDELPCNSCISTRNHSSWQRVCWQKPALQPVQKLFYSLSYWQIWKFFKICCLDAGCYVFVLFICSCFKILSMEWNVQWLEWCITHAKSNNLSPLIVFFHLSSYTHLLLTITHRLRDLNMNLEFYMICVLCFLALAVIWIQLYRCVKCFDTPALPQCTLWVFFAAACTIYHLSRPRFHHPGTTCMTRSERKYW